MPGVHRDGGRLVHRRGRCGGARGADVDSWGMDPAQRPFLRSPRGADPQSPVDAATVIASGQYGIITLQQAREYGLSKNDLRRLVRRKEWLRPHLRTYAVRRLVPAAHSPERLRCLAMAAQLAVGPGSCVAGQTAARLWGIRGLERWDGRQVHIAVPAVKIPRTLTGVELHGWDVRPEEVTEIGHGVRITEPGRTLCDTLPTLDRETAVCLMDSALHQGLLREENIEAMNRAIRGRRGCLDVRRWWGLADGRSQSPLETRVRLVRVDGGLPPDELQRRFTDQAGRTVAVVDFWWERPRLIGEADGHGPHSTPYALARDRERQNALQRLYPDVRIVRFTWADLHRPKYILALVAGEE